jgi:hypothetical protein
VKKPRHVERVDGLSLYLSSIIGKDQGTGKEPDAKTVIIRHTKNGSPDTPMQKEESGLPSFRTLKRINSLILSLVGVPFIF